MSRPDTTRTTTDQVINRRDKNQLVTGPNKELDNYLDSIDSELKQPLRIKASRTGSYTVAVEAINVENPETLVNRSRHPIRKKIPVFAGATISFPTTSGNPVLVTPGVSEDLVLDADQYAKILIQVDDAGNLYLLRGFQAATEEDAKLPKPKSGLHSIGFLTLHMGAGGVLDPITEAMVTQFQGPEDNQDYIETLRVRENRANYKTVTLTGADFLGSDDNVWGHTLEGKKLKFAGAIINLETGVVTGPDGVTPLGDNFAAAPIAATFWQWYSINIVPTTPDVNNEMQAKVLVLPAANPGTTMANAPRAPWVDHEKGIRIAQVAVQGGAVLGEIELVFDANIIHKAVSSSEGEGRRNGVTNVPDLKAIPLYERHHHMLRLVQSDLQGRGVLYRWDEFSTSAETIGIAEIGEAPKVIEPDDGVGRWHTITAMDIGVSVVRTDMIRNDNVTLDHLAHTDPYRLIGFNGSGTPSYLFETDLTDGSALEPTYSFALDQDTGIFRAGDGSMAYTSNGEMKWVHEPTASVDTFRYTAGGKNINILANAPDTYISEVSAHGDIEGTGRIFAGESALNGGGFGWNGDDTPDVSFGRINAVSHFRRQLGVETEVFWYRNSNNNVHFNGMVTLQDNNLAEGNPEPGYLGLVQDGDTLYTRTSGGTTTPVLNQTQGDARYLRRNANDVPSADNTWTLGSSGARWAGIYSVWFYGRATSANYADLAERYESDCEMQPGDVVRLGGKKEITHTQSAGDTEVFGVISTDPAFRMNDNVGDDDKTKPFVAFAGRVPCKVRGKIKKGQRLQTSDIKGVAELCINDGDYRIVIGRALEDKNTDDIGLVEIAVGAK